MKKLWIIAIVLLAFVACNRLKHHRHHHEIVTVVEEADRDAIEHIRRLGQFRQVRYETVHEDLSGKPFKIKLYLYDDNGRMDHRAAATLSRRCAARLMHVLDEAKSYKLVEVNLIGSQEQESYIYHTSNL